MHCYWSWGTVLIAGLLAAGCHSPPQQSSASLPATPPARGTQEATPDPASDKLARAHAHYAAGVVHDMEDDSEAALQEYAQAATLDPDNEALVLDVSRRFLQNKQPEKALDVLSQAATRPGASGAVFARLGLVYLQLGKREQCVAASRTAIKRSPDSLAGYQNLYLNYLQNKQNQEALKVLDEAARVKNANADFLVSLAELYESFQLQVPTQKELVRTNALAALRRAEVLPAESPSLRVRLAEAFSAFGDSSKAADVYLELLKSLPDVPLVRERVHARLASIFLRDSDRKRAIEQLEALVHDDPTNPQAYYWLGYLAYSEKKPGEAVEYLSKAILLKPDFEDAYYDLALAQLAFDKPAEALVTLDRARTQFPKNFVMELYAGLACTRQKAYKDAIQHYTEAEIIAKATDPSRLNQEFYFQLGAVYERVEDYGQAERYFEQCLKLKPDFPEAQNYLGYMWAEHGMKLDKARELIEKAVKAEPKNAAYLDSMAWVLFKLKEPQEALSFVLKAVELTEQPDATLYDHLGDIYAALHQPEKAREAWTKSLSVEANEQVRQKLQGQAQNEVAPH